MKCSKIDCSNEARYVTDSGVLTCGLCPIKAGVDSIKISDVGCLLILARALTIQTDQRAIDRTMAKLRSLLGQMP